MTNDKDQIQMQMLRKTNKMHFYWKNDNIVRGPSLVRN